MSSGLSLASGVTATPSLFIPNVSLTLAQLSAAYPAASYVGYTAYTTDQGLVVSTGVAWLVNTDTSIKAALLPGAGNATVNATAIMAAAGQNLTVKLPAGSFYVGPMNLPNGGCQITGEGAFSTTLTFVPTGNSVAPGYSTVDPGSCFQVCASAGQTIIYNSSLKNLTIQSTDTTFTKAAVRLCETSQYVLQDLVISGFWGGDSCGLQTLGHESLSVKRLNCSAAIPIRISVGLKAYSNPVVGVAITGVAGQFSCTSNAGLVAGQQMTISGTYGGTGSITGYVDPTTYRISAATATTFTLTKQDGTAIVTAVGTPTGLTYVSGIVYSGDHFHYEDLYLIAGLGAGNVKTQAAQYYPLTLTSACVLMDDNCFVSNLTFDGRQAWVGGQYGFYCQMPSYPGSITYNWSFKNIRKEQGFTNSTFFYFNYTGSTTYVLRQVYFENCYNTEGFTGWNLNGLHYATMVNCMSPSQAGFYVVAATSNILGMEWRGMWALSTDVNNLTTTLGNPTNANYQVNYKTPFSASWSGLSIPVAGEAVVVTTPVTAFSITFNNWQTIQVLTPAGTLATGTVTMCANPTDKQEANISTSQTITALTVNANAGQSIVGAPTTMAAGTGARFIYWATTTTWYRLN